nr:hypothetical protein [Tanacetum cinerariifolium]
MREPTMEEYMTKTKEDYGSWIARLKFDKEAKFKLKGQFLKELRDNSFSGSKDEDANEHIERVLGIIDLFTTPKLISDGLAAIQAQLNNIGMKNKNVNEKVKKERRSKKHSTLNLRYHFHKQEGRLLEEKWRINQEIKAKMNEHCLTVVKDTQPLKIKDPGSFTLPYDIDDVCFDKALADLGASVIVMPYSTFTNPGILGDKIICDLDKLPDLSQRSPQNCPKFGNPVNDHYCQGCALLRKKFKEDLFTYCIENGILQDASKPSNENTNVLNALQESFIVNQDPGKNSSQSPPQINHHCCYECGDPLEDIFCHQCTCELCGKGAHYGYNCPPKFLIVPDPEPCHNQNVDELPQTVPSFDTTCYSEDGNSFTYDPTSNLFHETPNVFNPPLQPPIYSYEFCRNDAYYGHDCLLQVPFTYDPELVSQEAYKCQPMNEDYYHEQNSCYDPNSFGFDQIQPPQYTEEDKQIEEEQAAKTRYWKIPACYDDDDDDDYTIAVTPNEFITSSVENLVPNPSESEGGNECDVPACEVFTTFSNILFDADYNFYSVDDQPYSDEDIPKKIYSNLLFDEEIISMKMDPHHFNAESDLIESLLNRDSLIISSSSKIDSLFDEFAGKLTLLKLILSGINETDCDPENEIRFIKRLLYDNSSPYDPMPSGIEEDDYDSERDILIFEELLSNDSLSLPENESFHFDIPSSSRPPAKPPDGNTGIFNVKAMGDISEHKVPMPRLMSTQPTPVPNQEKSPDLLPHLGHEIF